MACWGDFVLACRILCKHSLTIADINLSDALLLRFCRQVQSLYGEMAITPNMHLHAHLKESLLDYGPVYEFGLFSYKHCNGILGNQPTNNRHIEPQLMRRFLDSNSAYELQFPDEFSEEFSPLCQTQAQVTGSMLDTLNDNDDIGVNKVYL